MFDCRLKILLSFACNPSICSCRDTPNLMLIFILKEIFESSWKFVDAKIYTLHCK